MDGRKYTEAELKCMTIAQIDKLATEKSYKLMGRLKAHRIASFLRYQEAEMNNVELAMIDQHGSEMIIRMDKNKPLDNAFKAYTQWRCGQYGQFTFMLGEEMIDGNETPQSLGMGYKTAVFVV